MSIKFQTDKRIKKEAKRDAPSLVLFINSSSASGFLLNASNT